jgi:hypothetical protein
MIESEDHASFILLILRDEMVDYRHVARCFTVKERTQIIFRTQVHNIDQPESTNTYPFT